MTLPNPCTVTITVYALDQRGRGDTDHAPGGDYSTDAFVADLVGFLDAIGLDKFILFGHSMGGRNSMAFAGEHAERLERLCIVDIGPRIEPAGGNPHHQRTARPAA